MSHLLFDCCGARKYIVPRERQAFVSCALSDNAAFFLFCLTLAITGARISEVLALSARNVDLADEGIIFRTLKQRGKAKYRLVPAPLFLLIRLAALQQEEALDFGRFDERVHGGV